MTGDRQHQIQYGDSTIQYELTYSPRKTLAISVHPDLHVTVDAPENTEFDAIQAKVYKRANWILKQKRDFERYLPHLPPKEYISGETHYYLGRQYRLKVIEDGTEGVKLTRGRIIIWAADKDDRAHIRKLLDNWYMGHAERVFHELIEDVLPRFRSFAMPYPTLKIRPLKARWGSCSDSGEITLNLKLMQVPKKFIDYVIVHELCHLIEHNHSRRFYLLLDRLLPDWRTLRSALNEFTFH